MILTPEAYQNALDFLHNQSACVRRLSQKLLNLVGANHFALIHSQNDAEIAGFGVNVDAMNCWMEQGMPLPFAIPNGFYLTTHFAALFPDNALETLREKYEADHILFYVQHNYDSTDIFAISANPENTLALNNYINHAHTMKKFFIHFKQETKRLLQQAQKDFSIGYNFSPQLQKKLFPVEVKIINHNGFSSLGDIANILSPREFECLKLVSSMVSIKSIAQKLKLSPRTVESYLISTKNKLNCHTKSEMIDLYYALNSSEE
jgi:DNA-binding CsgD family transcriptional regulator